MADSSLNIVIAGVGGQGTVLASKLLAQTALAGGATVRSAETIGMAQRGGSVLGHVRIGLDREVDRGTQCKGDSSCVPLSTSASLSPLVPTGTANIIIGFEPGETLKALPYLQPGGLVVSATHALAPPTATLKRLNYDGREQLDFLRSLHDSGGIGKLVLVDGEQAVAQLRSSKVLNVVLLGATLQALDGLWQKHAAFLSSDSLRATINLLIKPQFLELNLRALELGAHTCK